ncbi:Hypothetical predicted protein [Paramuricea clavata]|uniref:Uncharacterized protein n=1 Tax=Paramuricea clavata TaxID=317549 RepID=A0A7D9DQD8_PARCT|nr:Hypothetical predicted protein [Paramuricea clavata]
MHMKTYNQQILQHRQDESNTSFIKVKEILHQTTSYELVRREDKGEVKITRLTNQPTNHGSINRTSMPDQ